MNITKIIKYWSILSKIVDIIVKIEMMREAPVGYSVEFSDIKWSVKGKVYEIKGKVERVQ